MAKGFDGSGKRSVAKLDKSGVEAGPVPPPGARAVLWDVEVKGFGIRVAPTGARTCVLLYRMDGREAPKRMVTIRRRGSPWTVDQTRRRAIELLASVRQGVDPLAERALVKSAAADAESGAPPVPSRSSPTAG